MDTEGKPTTVSEIPTEAFLNTVYSKPATASSVRKSSACQLAFGNTPRLCRRWEASLKVYEELEEIWDCPLACFEWLLGSIQVLRQPKNRILPPTPSSACQPPKNGLFQRGDPLKKSTVSIGSDPPTPLRADVILECPLRLYKCFRTLKYCSP